MDLNASVIIPTFEDWGGLQTCLDCLAGQSIDLRHFEVIVANNNPSPDVPPSLRLPSNARVIHVPSPGSYAARNAALRDARAEVLFFTDSDCLPDSHWIEAGLTAIASLGPMGRVAGSIELFPSGPHWTTNELYDRVHQMRQAQYVQQGWCATANLVTTKMAFDHVGLFDKDLYSFGDRNWNLRATEIGAEIVFSSDVRIRHSARALFADLAKKRRRILGGRHQEEIKQTLPKRPTRSYLWFVSNQEIRRTLSYPGLTDAQRLQILWVCFCLGFIAATEIVRLRYLRGKPTRS